ncbi:hypothetical protein TrLO_g15347 [Triparma laevis f. longispina]|uniref:Probable beta-glucosidase G n=1 Tax=Triparma laevis f. longispina TaxID=1714387 RepID=A0A9W7FD96_9STRA|nr:hypothetical protein TrLO_g15347 [Triparma laevis f. longispina]
MKFSLLALALSCPTLHAQNSGADDDIAALVADMTTAEKYSILNGVGFATKIQLSGYYVGNEPAVERLNIPSIKMQDAAQGFRTTDERMVGEVTAWPCSLAAAGAWDVALMEDWGHALGKEHRTKGANVILGPSVNVHRVAKGGRNAEYLSGESPKLGEEMVRSYVRGVQEEGVMAVVKHFALNNQENNRNTVDSHADERTMQEVYFLPFKAAVDEGVASFMCSYNLVNGTHSCGNEDLLQRDLKDRMGFEGFVMSDWWAVHDAGYQNAGLDMDMPGDDGYFSSDNLDASDEGRIDDMATRVLTQMKKVGLLGIGDSPAKFPNLCDIPNDCDDLYFNATATSPSHSSLALSIATQSVALLKNSDSVLPITGPKTIAVVGSACDAGNNISAMLKVWDLGNYYVMGGSGRVIAADPVSIVRGLKEGAGDSITIIESTTDNLDEALTAMEGADVVVTCGATTSTEGHDRDSLLVDQDDFITSLVEASTIPSVVLLNTPGATVTSNFSGKATAVLNMFLGGQVTGTAWSNIIYGVESPSGKLPVTFLKSEDDAVEPCSENPCVYDEKLEVGWRGLIEKDVDFCFGHGLSYTEFDYDIKSNDGLKFELSVENTGKTAGREVVQLYVTYPEAEDAPPVDLKGFKKTGLLQPGQSELVQFNIDSDDLRSWSVSVGDFVTVPGDFKIEFASSSRDARATATVTI